MFAVYSKPHAAMTLRASFKSGAGAHKNNTASGVARLGTGKAQILSVVIVG
jgi:hypothetical protein